MARTVPKGANRGPRDKQVTIYLSEEEIEALERISKNLGFRSKSSMIVYALEDLIQGGFGLASFSRLGLKFGDLIDKSGKGKFDWEGFLKLFRRNIKPAPKDYDDGSPKE